LDGGDLVFGADDEALKSKKDYILLIPFLLFGYLLDACLSGQKPTVPRKNDAQHVKVSSTTYLIPINLSLKHGAFLHYHLFAMI
jgi:hypothetical protein